MKRHPELSTRELRAVVEADDAVLLEIASIFGVAIYDYSDKGKVKKIAWDMENKTQMIRFLWRSRSYLKNTDLVIRDNTIYHRYEVKSPDERIADINVAAFKITEFVHGTKTDKIIGRYFRKRNDDALDDCLARVNRVVKKYERGKHSGNVSFFTIDFAELVELDSEFSVDWLGCRRRSDGEFEVYVK